MGMNAEYLRHIQKAEKAGNTTGAKFLKGQLDVFNAARDAGVVQELPLQKSSERTLEVVRFSPDTLEVFEKKGFLVYTPNGESIKTLRGSGRKIWSTWHKDYLDFEALPSRL